jgi:hypothetical protein
MQRLRRTAVVAACAALILIAVPSLARGQAQVNAPAGIDIFAIAGAGKVRVATVGANGSAEVPVTAAPVGARLEVVVQTCDGMMSVVLIQEGQTDPDCEDAPAGAGANQPRCTCRRSGVFLIWGSGDVITVSPAGAVTLAAPPVSAGGGSPIGVIIDLDVARASIGDADSKCDGNNSLALEFDLTPNCTFDGTSTAFSADVGVLFGRFLAVKVGLLRIAENTIDSEATSSTLRLTANGQFGPVTGATFVGSGRVPLGPVVLFGEAGMWRWSAESQSSLALFSGNQQLGSDTFSQENSGWDPIFGGGVELWFTPNVGISGGIRRVSLNAESTGEEGDVDDRYTITFVGLKLGWR